MSDIYVPIDYSDVKSVIPPGEDIIYSTLCKVTFHAGTVATGYSISKWTSHVLMTPNGLAYTIPNKKKKEPPLKFYCTWAEGIRHIATGKKGIFDTQSTILFTLIRDEKFETKETFIKREKEFQPKFRPLLIEKKEEWFKLNQDNPNIKQSTIKFMRKSLTDMINVEKSRLAKEAKKAEKEKKKEN